MDTTRRSDVRLRVANRSQMHMNMECLDELLPPDHQARVIWAAIERLDLSAFYEAIKAHPDSGGRDASDPQILISLWLYAATEGVGSARELDRLCGTDAAYRWICGGVSLNYHTISDFRTDHREGLDDLFSQTIALLVDKQLIQVRRISQDGLRVRANVGVKSYRREERLGKLMEEARRHLEEIGKQSEDPQVSARQAAARQRAARERVQRVQEAMDRMPELKRRQEKREKNDPKRRGKVVRASTTDASVDVIRMPDGGLRPGVNVQVGTAMEGRAIVGVMVSSSGSDAGLAEPMRRQVEERMGQSPQEQFIDGGYVSEETVERAAEQGVTLFMPPRPAQNPEKLGDEYQPRADDSPAIAEWRRRMGTAEAQAAYLQRASTSETVNADLRCWRGLGWLTIRGIGKITCLALWSALAYNLLHFGKALIG